MVLFASLCVCVFVRVCAAWHYRSLPAVGELWAHTELGMEAFLQDSVISTVLWALHLCISAWVFALIGLVKNSVVT